MHYKTNIWQNYWEGACSCTRTCFQRPCEKYLKNENFSENILSIDSKSTLRFDIYSLINTIK